MAGKGAARDGVRLVMFEKLSCLSSEGRAAAEAASWREVVRLYRLVLFEIGEEGTEQGQEGKKAYLEKRKPEFRKYPWLPW